MYNEDSSLYNYIETKKIDIVNNLFFQEVEVLNVLKKISYALNDDEIRKIKQSFYNIINLLMNDKDCLYYLNTSDSIQNNRLSNYFKLWKYLEKKEGDISFYNKIRVSKEFEIKSGNEIRFSALCAVDKNNFSEFVERVLKQDLFDINFYISSRNEDINNEYVIYDRLLNIDFNTIRGDIDSIEYYCRKGDIYCILYSNRHNGFYGMEVFCKKNIMSEIIKKIQFN